MAPRALDLIGRLADGWIPGGGISRIGEFGELTGRIDAAAIAAGRDPLAIRRIVNVSGTIADRPGQQGRLEGPPNMWVDVLSRWAIEHRLAAYVFWPADTSIDQIERFAGEVVPGVREAIAGSREGG
jgi:alkanesulfonate monooxygenase SsuD/methylene tetrahydromethanopterin reductase-like flavin-dependent oxidoreductase (luciferase family)